MIGGTPRWATDEVDEPVYKRIVVVDKDGLWVIVGRASAQPESIMVLKRDGQEVGFGLVKANTRYYLYKEIVPPQSGRTFHESQV